MDKRSLLLVDGDARSLRVLEVSLKKAGFTVTTAVSGRDALEKVRTAPPELIISDTEMGEMDGFEFCRTLKDNPEWRTIPFIFLTNQAGIENKIRGLELGVEDYLTKPIYIKEILTRVRILLQKRERAHLEEKKDSTTRFLGSLADMGVVDLIQTIEISRKTGLIHFTGGSGEGATIYFRDGKIIDADAGHLQGEDAVYRLLTWSEGVFEVLFRNVRRKDVIRMSSQGLLMEGMRRLDEWGRLCEQLPPLGSRFEVDYDELWDRLPDLPDELNPILRLIDGRRSLMEVIDRSGYGDLECLEVVAKLYFEGIIAERVTDGAPTEEASVPGEELVERAIGDATPAGLEEPPAPSLSVVAGSGDDIPAGGVDELREAAAHAAEAEQAAADAAAAAARDASEEGDPWAGTFDMDELASGAQVLSGEEVIADLEDILLGEEADPDWVGDDSTADDDEEEPDEDVDDTRGADSFVTEISGEFEVGAVPRAIADDSGPTPIPEPLSPRRTIRGMAVGRRTKLIKEEDEVSGELDQAALQEESDTPVGSKVISSEGAEIASVSGELALARIVPLSQTARQLVTISPSRSVVSEDAEEEQEEPTLDEVNGVNRPERRAALARTQRRSSSPPRPPAGSRARRRSTEPPAPLAVALPRADRVEARRPVPRRSNGIALVSAAAVLGAVAVLAILRTTASPRDEEEPTARTENQVPRAGQATEPPVELTVGVTSSPRPLGAAGAEHAAGEPTPAPSVDAAPAPVATTPDAAVAVAPTPPPQPEQVEKVEKVEKVERKPLPEPTPPGTPEVETADTLYRDAKRSLKRGDRRKALDQIERSLAMESSSRGLLLKADIQQAMGDAQQAMTTLDTATRGRASARVWKKKGLLHWELEQYADAKKALARYLELSPNAADADDVQALIDSM